MEKVVKDKADKQISRKSTIRLVTGHPLLGILSEALFQEISESDFSTTGSQRERLECFSPKNS